MPKRRRLNPQSVWDEALVRIAFKEAGVKESHIPRLYKHLSKDPHAAWDSIPDLPKTACQLLQADFTRLSSRVEQVQVSSDGTKKLLIRLQDGLKVESVIMVYDTSSYWRDTGKGEEQETGRVRSTLCISSQVGCQMGCTFCATGTMGLVADLTSAEILEQAVHALQYSPIRNIVFMGMGEPLNNYEAVRAAVSMLTDGRTFGFRRQKVTISTVGVVPRIQQLAEDLPGVSLAFSLHAPNQALRQSIVPSAKAYPLPKLMAALDAFLDSSRQKDAKVFVEYVMLAGVNDGSKEAHELGHLLQHRCSQYMVNLIPWNPVYSPSIDFQAPAPDSLADFHAILRSHGLLCTIRREMGQEISGACGQLVLERDRQQACGSKQRDIEELAAENLRSDPAAAKKWSLWAMFGRPTPV